MPYSRGSILKSLKDTEFSSRQGARERKLKWRQRSDQQGEDQLTDSTVKERLGLRRGIPKVTNRLRRENAETVLK